MLYFPMSCGSVLEVFKTFYVAIVISSMKYFKCHIKYYNRYINIFSSHEILQSSHKILQTSHEFFWKTSPISHIDTSSNDRRVGLEPTIQLAGKKTLLCQSNSLGPTISNSGEIDVRTFTLVKDIPEAWSTGSP